MTSRTLELAREIDRLRRRHASLLSELAGAVEAPTTWEMAGTSLCWHVVLRDVLEPDVDVEVLEEALIVRGCLSTGVVRHALLPVPRPFEIRRLVVLHRTEALEVRIERGGDDAD